MKKRLYKIDEGKMVDGVCGGVAEYLGIDPTVVRVVWAVISCCWGVGIGAYIICALLMPRKPGSIVDAE